jgi:hypothetical protein
MPHTPEILCRTEAECLVRCFAYIGYSGVGRVSDCCNPGVEVANSGAQRRVSRGAGRSLLGSRMR